MTGRVLMEPLHLPDGTPGARMTMAAKRANSLEPEFLKEMASALEQAEQQGIKVLQICGGRNFSSGGDVREFHAASLRGEAATYASNVVPLLQTIIYRLISMKCLVVVAARGAITGGGAGLLFAADLAVLAPDAFVQPYYSKVGFAPDGGWTALLPERMGAGKALEWLQSDRRLSAQDLQDAGLATTVSDTPEQTSLELVSDGPIGARLTAKALIWDEARRAAIHARLEAETVAFLERIGRPDTVLGMSRFLERIGGKPVV
jgi:2-(1,2-epoxy-1,2-dihydrophenyl)acetyl-CoA isomerase